MQDRFRSSLFPAYFPASTTIRVENRLGPAGAQAVRLHDFAKSDHRGSTRVSSTITCSLRYAAVPQDPTLGPISIPSINLT